MNPSLDPIEFVTVEALECEHCGRLPGGPQRRRLSGVLQRATHIYQQPYSEDENWMDVLVPCGGTISFLDVKFNAQRPR